MPFYGGGVFLFWRGEGFIIIIILNYFLCQSPLAPNFFGLTLADVYFESCWLNKHHSEASEQWGSQERNAAAATCY